MDWGDAVGEHISVEMHDSRMTAISAEDGVLVIQLSPAYIHRSTGRPGVDSGTLWEQDSVIRLEHYRLDGSIPPLPGWVMDGSVAFSGDLIENVIPIPMDFEGEIELVMAFDEGSGFRVRASRFQLGLSGKPTFIDVWPTV